MDKLNIKLAGSITGRSPILCNGSTSTILGLLNSYTNKDGVVDTAVSPHTINLDINSSNESELRVYVEYYSISDIVNVNLAHLLYCNKELNNNAAMNSILKCKFVKELKEQNIVDENNSVWKTLAQTVELFDGKTYKCILELLEEVNANPQLNTIKEYLYAAINTMDIKMQKSNLSFEDFLEVQETPYFKLFAKSITFKIYDDSKDTCYGVADVPVIFLPLFDNVGLVSDVYSADYNFDIRSLAYIGKLNSSAIRNYKSLLTEINLIASNKDLHLVNVLFNVILHNMVTLVLREDRQYGNELYSYTAKKVIQRFSESTFLASLI